MAFQANDAVVFVPGLLGFGRFGSDEAPLIRYFDHVAGVLGKRLGVPNFEQRCLFHEPPPTGPLDLRVGSLARAVDQVLTEGLPHLKDVARVHIIGHSTGGLDARLLVNRSYGLLGGPTASDKRALLGRIATVVSVSAPLRGAPFAARVAKDVEGVAGGVPHAIRILFLLTILNAGRKRLGFSFAGQLARATASVASTENALRLVTTIDARAARQIARFLELVECDHRLFQNLEPESMRELNARIAEGDKMHIHSFATVSPRPRRLTVDFARLLYAFAYGKAQPKQPEEAPFPAGTWMGPHGPELETRTANDGIVPTASQWCGPGNRWIIQADHLDVVGHFDGALETLFKSGADMTPQRFSDLWDEIARAM